VRVIKPSTLRRYWAASPGAEKALRIWLKTAKAARWENTADVKSAFGVRVDFVKVASGNTVAVFDIANNNWRLIAAFHYDRQRVFTLRVLTHKEYDTNKWKQEL
jgi:mRNA interferase HigB